MSIDTEIEAAVSAFMTDLAEIIRETAVRCVDEAFESLDVRAARRPDSTARGRTKSKGVRRASVASSDDRAVERKTAPAPATDAGTAQLSLSIWPTARPIAPSTSPAPPPVVRRFPPKRRRTPRASAPVTTAPAPAGDKTPAKSWVVKRRGGSAAPADAAAPAPAEPVAPAPAPVERKAD